MFNQDKKDFKDLLVDCDLCKSKSEAQRLIKQGAIKIHNQNQDGFIIQIGKRRFRKIIWEK